jgi:hypothetical protein
MGADSAARAIFVVVSRRNAALRVDACSGRRGGQSRVFEYPGRGTFAMAPMAQRPLDEPGVSLSSYFRPFIAETTLYPSIAAKESATALMSVRVSSGRGRKLLVLGASEKVTGPCSFSSDSLMTDTNGPIR